MDSVTIQLGSCITQAPLYTFKAVLVLDVVGWLLVGMDRRWWWTKGLFLFNVGLITMVVIRVMFPNPDWFDLSPDLWYSGGGVGAMVLLGIALRSAVVGAIVTSIAGSLAVGVFISYAEDYAKKTFEDAFGRDLDQNTYVIIAGVAFVLLIIAYLLLKFVADVAMMLMRSAALSIMVGVAVHTVMNNNIISDTKICCDDEHRDKCPIWLTPMNYGIVIGLFIGRVALYTLYRMQCVSKDKEKKKKKEVDSASTPLLSVRHNAGFVEQQRRKAQRFKKKDDVVIQEEDEFIER